MMPRPPGMALSVHPNDVGLRARVKAAPVGPKPSNDVGLAKHLPRAASAGGLSINEIHSKREMKGRQPRA